MHTHSAGATGELFLNHKNLLLGKSESAVLLRQCETIEVILDCCLIEFRRECVGNLNFLLHFIERALSQRTNLKQVILELLFSQFHSVVLLIGL